MSNKTLLTFWVLCLSIVTALGQNISVKASLDSTEMLIGAQAKITLEITKPKGRQVAFPFVTDTITRAVEVLDVSPIDSTTNEAGNSILSRVLTVTSFDSGYHILPAFQFYTPDANGKIDTLLSNSLAFEVKLVAVDTTQSIKPIKGVEELPFTFKEALPYILVAILLFILAIGAYILFKNRKQPAELVKVSTPKEAAHILALRALGQLKEEKLWQAGKIKAYYSRLTDIMREYIEGRYQIPAVESTSDEILSSFRNAGLSQKVPFENLERLLFLSDIVKFAKGKPSLDEHMQSFDIAYDFVKQTIKKEIEN